MRVVLMAMFLMLAGHRAEACPHGTVCVSAETRSQVGGQTEIARPRSMLQVAIARAERIPAMARLDASLRAHVVRRPDGVEMPWIWVQLRRSVYSQLPRYERISRHAEHRFSLVLSPVVVTSPQDTVPGVGVEGDF